MKPRLTAPLLRGVTQLALFVGVLLALTVGGTPAVAGVEVNAQEQAIFNYMKSNGGQRRPFLVLDPILCKVARQKAADMAARGYFSHTDPSGRGANYLVRQAGYVLPAGYDPSASGNNIESLSAGRDSASKTWSDWLGSSGHRRHLLGENVFFAEQTSVGVGFVNVPGSEWQWYWVVLSAPPSGPQLSISSPANNAKVNDSSVTFSGKTGGEPAASKVQLRVENSSGQGAWVTASGTTSWTASLSNLAPGSNTIRIQSLNGTSVLRESTRTVRYAVMAPVTFNVAGSGTITAAFNGTTMREVGTEYTVVATPKNGYLFSGWTGSLTGSARTVKFKPVLGGMSVTANFIPNPFVKGVGAYSALFTGSNDSHGRLKISLTSNGSFSGGLLVNESNYAIKGRFDVAGNAVVTVKTKSGEIFTLNLRYSNATGTPDVSGTIAGNGWNSNLDLDAQAKATGTRNPNAGRYTVVLAAPADDSGGVPSGDGAATVVVAGSGVAKISGALADGRTFAAQWRLTGDALQVYIRPYNGKGLLSGKLNFRAQQHSDLDGQMFWARPAKPTAARFAGGFSSTVNAVGSRYVAPTAGNLVVPVSAGQDNTALALGNGGLTDPLVQPTTLSASNSLIISNRKVKGLSAKLNPVNGVFTGKFVHPETGVQSSFRGVILQKQGAGFGFFAGGSKAGYATFTPIEQAPQGAL